MYFTLPHSFYFSHLITLRQRKNVLLHLGSSTGEMIVGVVVWVWLPLRVRIVMMKRRRRRRLGMRL